MKLVMKLVNKILNLVNSMNDNLDNGGQSVVVIEFIFIEVNVGTKIIYHFSY